MPQFRNGDRVQLSGDIARFYACGVGIVIDREGDPVSALKQYSVRLADGTDAVFFDFQLQNLAAVPARVVFDSAAPGKTDVTQHGGSQRSLQFIAGDVEIRLRIPAGTKNVLAGQVTSGIHPPGCALMTIDQNGRTVTKPANPAGEFEFTDVLEGDVRIEFVAHGRKVLISLTV